MVCQLMLNTYGKVFTNKRISIPPKSVRTPCWSCDGLRNQGNMNPPLSDKENNLYLASNTFLLNVRRQRHKLKESCPTTNSSYNDRISFTNLFVRFSILHTHGQSVPLRFLHCLWTSD